MQIPQDQLTASERGAPPTRYVQTEIQPQHTGHSLRRLPLSGMIGACSMGKALPRPFLSPGVLNARPRYLDAGNLVPSTGAERTPVLATHSLTIQPPLVHCPPSDPDWFRRSLTSSFHDPRDRHRFYSWAQLLGLRWNLSLDADRRAER
jgi:hypothetical protein